MYRECWFGFISFAFTNADDESHPFYYSFIHSCMNTIPSILLFMLQMESGSKECHQRWHPHITALEPTRIGGYIHFRSERRRRRKKTSQESSYSVNITFSSYFFLQLLRLLCVWCECRTHVRVCVCAGLRWLVECVDCARSVCCDICWECTVLAVIHLDEFYTYIHFTYFSFIFVVVAVLLWLASLSVSLRARLLPRPGSQWSRAGL